MARHRVWAIDWVVGLRQQAGREPGPLVTLIFKRTAANILSIESVVQRRAEAIVRDAISHFATMGGSSENRGATPWQRRGSPPSVIHPASIRRRYGSQPSRC